MGLVAKYGGQTILTVNSDAIFKLLTSGKMMSDDVRLEYTGIPIDETTAIASDVTAGKYFFDALGQKTLGTAPVVYELLGQQDFTVNTTSTAASSVGSFTVEGAYTDAAIIYVKIRDKAGPRNGYFTGSDCFFVNNWPRTSTQTQAIQNGGRIIVRKDSNGYFQAYSAGGTSGYGVYAYSISDGGSILVYRRYNSSYSLTINGTYNVQVYKLRYAPTQGDPFDYSYA